MLRFAVRRLLSAIPVLLAAATIVWIVMFLLPGDPARLLAGAHAADPAVLEAIRAEWNLDDPAPARYAAFLLRLLRGDLGDSYIQRRPVAAILAEHVPATLILAVAAMALSAIGGIVLGAVAALRRGGAADACVLVLALVGASTPVFWLGLMLMLLFGTHLGWLPVLGYGMDGAIVPFTRFRLPEWDHLVLPALTLSLVSMGSNARLVRASLAEAGAADYLRAAAARGLSPARVFARHALKNALIPVVTVIGLDFAAMLGGAVATEYVFAWPGLGKAIVRAVALRDLPVVEGGVLFLTLVFVGVNCGVDLVVMALDPRLRRGRGAAA